MYCLKTNFYIFYFSYAAICYIIVICFNHLALEYSPYCQWLCFFCQMWTVHGMVWHVLWFVFLYFFYFVILLLNYYLLLKYGGWLVSDDLVCCLFASQTLSLSLSLSLSTLWVHSIYFYYMLILQSIANFVSIWWEKQLVQLV